MILIVELMELKKEFVSWRTAQKKKINPNEAWGE